jgi:shikimate kinase / 3-dehydroquinate synthase
VTQRPLPAPPLPQGRPRLVITGFMGTGKTAAGRDAAARLGLPFFDLDDVVEARAGMTVSQLFDRLGEEEFRARERQVLADAAQISAAVIATGGGAPLQGDYWTALADGAVAVVLEAGAEEIERRLVGGGVRPLLAPDPPRRIRELLAGRKHAYAAAGEPIATDGLDAEAVGARLAERYRTVAQPSPLEVVVGGEVGTSVLVGEGALDRVGERIAGAVAGTSAVIVADQAAVDGIGKQLRAGLEAAGLRPTVVVIRGGEEAKSVEKLAWLWERFRDAGLDRTGTVVAVGGGTVLDISGMAAATYARGVALVNVPTTLLAMVDAGLGGKVGINHAGVKNLAGAFHHPRVVAVDPAALASAPCPAIRGGLAEIAKVGVLASPLVLDVLADASGGDLHRHLGWLVEQAVRIKAGYVAQDPFDRGVRAALNLGHTFAHAIEAASMYEVSHGEAVAVGLLAAARLGTEAGLTPNGLEEQLTDLLVRLGLPAECPDLPKEAVLAAMRSDKKWTSEGAAFIVPAARGAFVLDGVDLRDALAALYPARGRVFHG